MAVIRVFYWDCLLVGACSVLVLPYVGLLCCVFDVVQLAMLFLLPWVRSAYCVGRESRILALFL